MSITEFVFVVCQGLGLIGLICMLVYGDSVERRARAIEDELSEIRGTLRARFDNAEDQELDTRAVVREVAGKVERIANTVDGSDALLRHVADTLSEVRATQRRPVDQRAWGARRPSGWAIKDGKEWYQRGFKTKTAAEAWRQHLIGRENCTPAAVVSSPIPAVDRARKGAA